MKSYLTGLLWVFLALCLPNLQANANEAVLDVARFGEWSVEAGGGWNFLPNASILVIDPADPTTGFPDRDDSHIIYIAVSRDLPMISEALNLELEGAWRKNEFSNTALFVSPFFSGTTDVSGEEEVWSAVIGPRLETEILAGVSLFGGVGAGIALYDIDFQRGPGSPGTVIAQGDDTRFAFQAKAGVAVELAPGVSLVGTYRFFGTSGSEMRVFNTGLGGVVNGASPYDESHSVTIGLRISN